MRVVCGICRRHGGLIALLVAIACFHLATIREGNTWGDDFALYILHAQNIATGKAYADTGYIYNRAVPEYGPRAYPPIFPLLLAPVYRMFGLNLWAMKCQQVVFLLLALAIVHASLRRWTTAGNALAVVAILGFNPNFWAAKDCVLSDLPFLFFFWLAAWLVWNHECLGWKWALSLGLVMYLAVGTRTIGFTIVAGVLLFELLRTRKLMLFPALAMVLCLGLLAVQTWIVGFGQGSYLDQLHATFFGVLSNAAVYARRLATFWMGSSKSFLNFLILALTSALAWFGARAHFKCRITAIECILLLYLCAVVLWPAPPGFRFLLPLVPFYVYLAITGLSQLSKQWTTLTAQPVLAMLLLLIGIGYLSAYRHSDFRIIPETDGLSSFNDMCDRIRAVTRGDAVLLCRRPRALTLFTGRPAAVYQSGDDAHLWRFAEQIQAAYVLCNRREAQDVEFLLPWIARYESNMELTYQNADFGLYRIRSYDLGGANRKSE